MSWDFNVCPPAVDWHPVQRLSVSVLSGIGARPRTGEAAESSLLKTTALILNKSFVPEPLSVH